MQDELDEQLTPKRTERGLWTVLTMLQVFLSDARNSADAPGNEPMVAAIATHEPSTAMGSCRDNRTDLIGAFGMFVRFMRLNGRSAGKTLVFS
jgi:hypothetical protein